MADAADDLREFDEERWERRESIKKACGKPHEKPLKCKFEINHGVGGAIICAVCRKHFG